ncbi:hypothetical protein MMC06_003361 [Schaereria dolodes]|nr:hypothetical protein [Schaereria dolodes]
MSGVPQVQHSTPMFQPQLAMQTRSSPSRRSDGSIMLERVPEMTASALRPSLSLKIDSSKPRQGRKRKSSTVNLPEPLDSKNLPTKKNSHNLIEKRYRTNLNDKIAQLRDSVPCLRSPPKATTGQGDSEGSDEEGSNLSQKLNKATILTKATEYIQQLEKRNQHLEKEYNSLQVRLQAAQKLTQTARTATTTLGHGDLTYTGATSTPQTGMYTQQIMQPFEDAQGWIRKPDDIRRFRDSSFQPYYTEQTVYQNSPAEAFQRPNANHTRHVLGPTGKLVGKLMVGSLAGFMIIEGFNEKENGSDTPRRQGLFAFPGELLSFLSQYRAFLCKDFSSWVGTVFFHKLVPFLKFSIMVMMLLFVGFLYLFNSKPKRGKRSPSSELSAPPPLASPLEIRQRAWLTSIQTVWVPQHKIPHEMAALTLKFLKYSMRRAIGWRGYSWLTGTTEDEELARIRAWDIAIDAHLAGGDAEISKSRLVLTVLASGTLPPAPARLMLKALHVRLLLWEAVRSQWTILYPMHRLAAMMARRQWWLARHVQNIPEEGDTLGPDSAEAFPEHLSKLLELDCDVVMTDSVIQRAYNLAWNRPTTEDTEGIDVGMDIVTEDYAIRSSLDALAAWWSSSVLQKALLATLKTGRASEEEVVQDIDMALRTAPEASSAQTRALAARALLDDAHRIADITAIRQALPSETTNDSATTRLRYSATFIDTTTPITACNGIRIAMRAATLLTALAGGLHDAQELHNITDSLASIRLDPTNLSLLGFVAIYHLLIVIHKTATAIGQQVPAVQSLASALCVWIRSDAAGENGIDDEARSKLHEEFEAMVKSCDSTRRFSSGSADTGYVSMSE